MARFPRIDSQICAVKLANRRFEAMRANRSNVMISWGFSANQFARITRSWVTEMLESVESLSFESLQLCTEDAAAESGIPEFL